jgi:hypothetical protein
MERYEWIHKDKLTVDTEYQRVLKQPRVVKMRRDWNPNLCGALVISQRDDGSNVVIDGQHRHAGSPDGTEFMCQILTGLTQEKEAEIFLRRNQSQVKPTVLDEYRAGLVARLEPYVTVDRVVTSRGLVITQSQQSNGISSVRTLLRIVAGRKDGTGDQALGQTLDVILTGLGQNKNSWHHYVLGGVGYLVVRNPHIDVERLAGVVSRYNHMQLRSMAQKITMGGQGTGLEEALAAVLANAYNSRLTNQKKRLRYGQVS